MTFGPLHTNKLVEFLVDRPPSKLVSYDRIAKLIGEPYPSNTARRSFYAARDVLLKKHGKLVLTKAGKGHYIADANHRDAYKHHLDRRLTNIVVRRTFVNLAA